MLLGGDDISNDVITLGMCFSMFVYIRAHFQFILIARNLMKSLCLNYHFSGSQLVEN